jgi:hypothetical protein
MDTNFHAFLLAPPDLLSICYLLSGYWSCAQRQAHTAKRRGNTESGKNCSPESPRNFGNTTTAPPMIHRNLQNTGMSLCDQHLHLKIPAVRFLSHGQRPQKL